MKRNIKTYCLFLFLILFLVGRNSQLFAGSISGKVLCQDTAIQCYGVEIILQPIDKKTTSNQQCFFEFSNIPNGVYYISANYTGLQAPPQKITIKNNQDIQINLILKEKIKELGIVNILAKKQNTHERMKSVEGVGIYEGKKTDVVKLSLIDANLATNNSRQLFGKVAGINVIENDGAGIQMGIGVRGLNPNRISEFNTRQNGYDISADALGYPESYYTPPTEGVEKIEITRGAAGLQYGPQFGGLVNFVMKDAPDSYRVELNSKQTIGSYGLFNSFNSVGGTIGSTKYYLFFHHKEGNGWRERSGFNINTLYGSVKQRIGGRLELGLAFTLMDYLIQQPGGLTEAQFYANPQQATRFRNWFQAKWFLPSLDINYYISDESSINLRTFGLNGSRASLGNLIAPTLSDYKQNRLLLKDNYNNKGTELRYLTSYKIKEIKQSWLIGMRLYQGNTLRDQGLANGDTIANFSFLNPDSLEFSSFKFPSTNIALFSEHIFRLSNKLTITPGIRWEYINTSAKGYYQSDFRLIKEEKNNGRNFPLLGIGTVYYPFDNFQLYGNFSQSYAAVNFNDIRVINPTFQVDPNLKDMKGFNSEIGCRGNIKNYLNYDFNAFYLGYFNRVGVINKVDSNFNIFRYRTNISNSRSMGLESFVEVFPLDILHINGYGNLSFFNSFSFVDARYIKTPVKAIQGKFVEYAPNIIERAGVTYRIARFSCSYYISYTSEQFTEATNTPFTLNAINGRIPAYSVQDFTLSYRYKIFACSFSANNLTDKKYFTRRADGYPGPGIIPSDGRTFFLTLSAKLGVR